MDDDLTLVLPARHRLLLDDLVIREIAFMLGWWSLLDKLCQTLQGISGCALRRSSDHHRTGKRKMGRAADLLSRWRRGLPGNGGQRDGGFHDDLRGMWWQGREGG